MASEFYHGITKSVVGSFGFIFSNLHIKRRKHDTVNGDVWQELKVPISYAPKMKWWEAINSDPARQKQVNVTLPRMSYEIMGFTYDPTRKLTRGNSINCVTPNGNMSVKTPSPWNIEFALYLVANNQEDILQMMEQILPLFNPDYTIRIKTISEMNLPMNIPISLNSVAIEDNYDGDYTSHRLIVYTLSFTAKVMYYGEVQKNGVITDVQYNVDADKEKGYYQIKVDGETGNVIIDEWYWPSKPNNKQE